MRVTNKMMSSNVLHNLQTNMGKLDRTNDILSKGTKINTPQDDPTGAVKTMSYKTTLEEIGKFLDNVHNAKTFLSYTDVSLGQATEVLHRIRELSVNAATETYEQTARDAIAAEVSELINQLVAIGNSKVGNRYIFAGHETLIAPFESKTGAVLKKDEGIEPDLIDINGVFRDDINAENIVQVKYVGDDGKLISEVDKGIILDYGVSGDKVFKDQDEDLFEVLIRLRDQILRGNTTENQVDEKISISGELKSLDRLFNRVMRYRARVGAKMRRIEQVGQRLNDKKISMSSLLSETQDTDIAEAISKLKVQESVQRMSLSVGAKVMQPTLLDFLR